MSWEAISYLLLGVVVYVALINWPPARHRPYLIGWTILLAGIGLTLAAPLLTELSLSKLFRVPALDAFLQRLHALVPGDVNANRLAGVLVLTIPLPVALAVRRDWSHRRWLPIACALLVVPMLLALVLTQSRAGYMATAVAIGVILLLRWPKLWYAVPVVVIVGAIAVSRLGHTSCWMASLGRRVERAGRSPGIVEPRPIRH